MIWSPAVGMLIKRKTRNKANQTLYSVGGIPVLATICVAIMKTPPAPVAITSQPLWRKKVAWLSCACVGAGRVVFGDFKRALAVAGLTLRNQWLFCRWRSSPARLERFDSRPAPGCAGAPT